MSNGWGGSTATNNNTTRSSLVNLVAGKTREGGVLKTLLDKLEMIRKELQSDKVFDVVGRLFKNVPLKTYLETAVTESEAMAINGINGVLTVEQVRALNERDRTLCSGGEVKDRLPGLQAAMDQEQYRRLLPGYTRCFITSATPLINVRVNGDLDNVFQMRQTQQVGLDPLLSAMEMYDASEHPRFTIYRPTERSDIIWLHPGEPVFDRFCTTLLLRHKDEARRGTFFINPHASTPYLFHPARVWIVRRSPRLAPTNPGGASRVSSNPDQNEASSEIVESRLVGLRQDGDGSIKPAPVEHLLLLLLLLEGAPHVPPGSVPLARIAHRLTEKACEWLQSNELTRLVNEHRGRIKDALPEQLEWSARGCDHKAAELIGKRERVTRQARAGDAQAAAKLPSIKNEQRRLAADKKDQLRQLEIEPSLVAAGGAEMVAHALILPTSDPEERERYNIQVEEIAMRIARAHEEGSGATVSDVSRPELARRAGLGDWPGFDMLSVTAAGNRRHIEVKGRTGTGEIQLSDNEWAKACNLRDSYWLYAVYDCATPRPRLVRVRNPFAKLLARSRTLSAYTIPAACVHAAAQATAGTETSDERRQST